MQNAETNQFRSLEQLQISFRERKVQLTPTLIINDQQYEFVTFSPNTMQDVFLDHSRTTVVAIYRLITNPNKNIVLMWNIKESSIIPLNVRLMDNSINNIKEQHDNDKVIGNSINVTITNLPNCSPLMGRVDTGASVCSLHVDSYNIKNKQITFVNKDLSPNNITMMLADKQAVKSADGGVEYRPVVILNIKLNDTLLNNIQFNLNDRSNMEYPILIGQNALKAGNFIIDPNLKESIDKCVSEVLSQNNNTDNIKENITTNNDIDMISSLVKQIQNSNISFRDIINYSKNYL